MSAATPFAQGSPAAAGADVSARILAVSTTPLARLPRPRPHTAEPEKPVAAPDTAEPDASAPDAATPPGEQPAPSEGQSGPSSEAPEAAPGATSESQPPPADEAGDAAASPDAAAPPDAAPPASSETDASDSSETAAPTSSESDTTTAPIPQPRPTDSAAETNGDQNAGVESGDVAPLPRPRPEISPAEAARLLATQFYGFKPDFLLRSALDAVEAGQYDEARSIAASHADALVPSLIDWLVARAPDSGLSAADVIAVLNSHHGWPEPERLQLRAEQAFHATGAQGEAVLAFYSQAEPMTVGGRLALAAALRDAGRSDEAKKIVRDLWRGWSLAPNQAGALLARFGLMLTPEDHLYRFRRLVLRSRTDDAVAQAQLLGDGYDDLARAVIAVLNRRRNAEALLDGVASKFLGDPLYVFARVHQLLRSDEPIEAARFLIGSQTDLELSGDGDIWWEERRDLSRALLDEHVPDLAYRVVADARPEGEGDRVEAAFHAGWYALRYLRDPVRAEPHFRLLHTLATLPRTQARASYWLGRTHEAEGHEAAARLDYVEAARFGGTFYGQLARGRLGINTTGFERLPRPSALDRIRFANRDLVKVIRLLAAAGYSDLSEPFLQELGESVDTPGEVALLTTLARRIGEAQAGMHAAAIAEERGLKVACLPALFVGVPADLRTPDAVDRALIYAVVRQESAFDHTAVSSAGARGLMQLMPATARATARSAQIPYSEQRLTTDPSYNATLGAHHLGQLLRGLNQSYVLTFAGYNAGTGRALEWVREYGDPRGGAVNPIDWIERIPFDETRDYVEKVMENLELYRSRTGHPLSLWQDLIRGGSQG